jgi:ligand-binding sensor domain-containing protein
MKQFSSLKVKIVPILTFLFLSVQTLAQRPDFKQIELPEEIRAVNALVAGKSNEVWIATAQGLYSYSNNKFTRFFEEEKATLYQINALATDAKGIMWWGTYHGFLVKFTNGIITATYDIKPKCKNSNHLITSISINKNNPTNNELLLTTSGGEIFGINPQTNTIRKIESPTNEIATIYSVLYGFSPTIWLCTSDGFYTMKKKSKWKKKPGLYTAYGLTENEKKYWAIGRDDQKKAVLMLYFNENNDPKKRFIWKNFELSNLTDIYTRFYELAFTKGEIAWIASQSGLLRYNPMTGSVRVYNKDKELDLKELQHVTTQNNQIWVSSSGRRFFRVDLN